jgi:hypothetical protein
LANDEYLLGATTLRDKLAAMRGIIPIEVSRALYEEAQIEMTEAKRRTPWEFGVLKGSGIVRKPVVNGREISVQLEFGGPAEAYAIYVHENLEALHPHGQAKFLESTLLESAPHMAGRIGRRIRLTDV